MLRHDTSRGLSTLLGKLDVRKKRPDFLPLVKCLLRNNSHLTKIPAV